MGFIFILPFTCLAVYCIVAIRRWLSRISPGEKWLTRYRYFSIAGAVLGLVFAFVVHYQVPLLKVEEGLPFPASFSRRDTTNAPWIPSTMPMPVKVGVQVTDFLYGVVICLAPLAIAAFLTENRGKLTNENNPPPPSSS